MNLGKRLRQLREAKRLTQTAFAQRVGLTRVFIIRVEHGYHTPSVKTLEQIAAGLEVPLYRFFYARKTPPRMILPRMVDGKQAAREIDLRYLLKLGRAIAKVLDADRAILLDLARKLARQSTV